MPGTVWPINRHPPDSSRDKDNAPVLMPSNAFRQLTCGSLSFAFIGSHLTHSKRHAFSRDASHHGSLPQQFASGLRSLPAERPRRAHLHLLHDNATRNPPSLPTLLLVVLLALMAHLLRAASDGDRRVLVDLGAVLSDEFGRHLQGMKCPPTLGRLDLGGDRLLAAVNLDRDLLLDGDGLRSRAEVAEGRQRTVGALGERQFEARDGLVGDGLEGG